MNDIDEIRTALREATRVPGEMHVRPAAAGLIRGDAIRRKHRTQAAAAATLAGCAVLVAALFASGVLFEPQVTTGPPASGPTAVPSSPVYPSPTVSIAPGPHTFSTPLEIHRVRAAYSPAKCPRDVPTLLSSDGTECYRLGTASMEITRVRALQTGPARPWQGATGVGAGTALRLSFTEADRKAFYALTREAANSENNRVAVVVADTVYSAPTTEVIAGGEIQILFDNDTDLRPFLSALGVKFSVVQVG